MLAWLYYLVGICFFAAAGLLVVVAPDAADPVIIAGMAGLFLAGLVSCAFGGFVDAILDASATLRRIEAQLSRMAGDRADEG